MPASALQTLGIGDDLGARYAAATAQSADAGQQIKKAQTDESAALAPVEKKINAENMNSPAAPKLDAIPDKFQFQDKPPEVKKEDMSTLMMFAVLGGAMTRAPMTAALNAYAAGANAYHQGQQEEYKKQMEEFDRNLNIAKDKNSQAMEEYRAAVEKHKGDLSGLMSEWNLIAKKYDDTVASAQLQQQNADGMMKHIESLAKGDQQFRMTLARMDQTDRRIADAEAKTDRQGWQVMKDKDGNLMRVNPGTGAVEPFNSDTKGLQKPGGGASQNQNRMIRVMAVDADNANYNFGKLSEMSKDRGSLIGGSPAFANHFGGSWTADFKRYLETGSIPDDLQGADALLMNLAFDIASGQSGGSGQLAQSKIAELEKQMPLDSMPEDVKQQRYQALFHRVKAINKQLPAESQVDLSPYEDTFGESAGGSGKRPAAGGIEYGGYHFPSQEALDKYKAAGGK